MKFITTLGAAAILAMGFTTSAQAGPVGGAQYEVENSCFIIWWFSLIRIVVTTVPEQVTFRPVNLSVR